MNIALRNVSFLNLKRGTRKVNTLQRKKTPGVLNRSKIYKVSQKNCYHVGIPDYWAKSAKNDQKRLTWSKAAQNGPDPNNSHRLKRSNIACMAQWGLIHGPQKSPSKFCWQLY